MAGLFDTVANVGMSPLVSMISGHFSWAHGTMSLERAAAARFVKSCYHFVAGHEQRKSFSVESICIDGGYPFGGGSEFREYTYPGVHADVGGGYPPGEQFKSNFGMGHVVAQVALHDMYARCWEHGMPMKIWADHPRLAEEIKKKPKFQLKNYEIMNQATSEEFETQTEMVTRFNAWRDISVTDNLDQNLRQQVHHITAWRILRWVRKGVKGYADFLGLEIFRATGTAGEKEKYEQVSAREKIIRQGRCQANEEARAKNGSGSLPPTEQPDLTKDDQLWQQAGLGNIPPEKRGEFLKGMINKNYDPRNDGWDMLESAKEFNADYLHFFRFESFLSLGFWLKAFAGSVYMLNNEDEAAEFKDIHDKGTALYFGKKKDEPTPAIPLPPSQDDGFKDDPVSVEIQTAQKGQTTPTAQVSNAPVPTTPPFAPKSTESDSSLKEMIKDADLGSLITGIGIDVLNRKMERIKAAQQAAIEGKKLKKPKLKDAIALGQDIWKRLKTKDTSEIQKLLIRIKKSPEGYKPDFPAVTQLFDEQIHDSRAKYMHTLLGDREPFTSYFAHRLIFSGSFSNKPLTPLMLQNNLVGLVGITRSAYMSIRYGNPAYILLGLNNPELFVTDADRKFLAELTDGIDAVVIDPDTGKVIMNGKNVKNLIELYKKAQKTIEQLQESLNQAQEWKKDDFIETIKNEIVQNGDETIKNLEQIRELLEQQKEELAKLKEAVLAHAASKAEMESAAAADEANASTAEAGGAETAANAEDELDSLLKKVDEEIQQLHQAMQPVKQSGAAATPAQVQNLLRQLDMAPADSAQQSLMNLSATERIPLAGNMGLGESLPIDGLAQAGEAVANVNAQLGAIANNQVHLLPTQQPFADINPQSMAEYLQAQISQYQHQLHQQTANTLTMLQNGVDDPQSLAQAFYRNAQGDIADQAVTNISRTTLDTLGLSELELNEFLPENIANRSQTEIAQLIEQLRSGDIPTELRSLPSHRLQLMAKVLECWIG